MIASRLQCQVFISTSIAPTLTITINNPYFLQSVELTSLSGFPLDYLESYEFQVHPKTVSFIPTQGNKNGRSIQKLAQIMQKVLGSIRMKTVKKRKRIEKQKLHYLMFRLLDFNCCCGYKRVGKDKEGFETGDLVLFYCAEEQNKVQGLISCIEGFSSKVLLYPLASLVKKYGLPEELAMRTLKQMLNFHAGEIQSVSVLHKIHISFMGICRRSESEEYDAEKFYFLAMNIEGVISNIHVFYVALEHTIQSFRPRVVEIDCIRRIKMNQIPDMLEYEAGTRMVDGRNIVVMDRNVSERDIAEAMIGDYIFSKNDFNEEERSILEFEIERERFRDYMDEKLMQFEAIKVQNNHVILTCHYNKITQLSKCLKQFLALFRKQTVKCSLFETPMVSSIFYKNYRQQIQSEINVKFSLTNGEIIRTNYTIDTQKINAEMNTVNEQILRNFVEVPSLTTVSKYLAKIHNFEGLYSVEKNPECMWERSWRSIKYRCEQSKVQISLIQFGNLINFEEQIVFMMHNDLLDLSKIYSISAQNKVDTKQFLKGCEGPRPCRVKKYPLKNSQKFNSITLLYFDVKRANIRHIQSDIHNCLKALEKEQKINILIGLNSKRFIDQIMPKFLNKANELSKQQEIKLKYLNVYYEDQALLNQLERVILNGKMQTTLITRDVLDEWSLLRMNNLKQFVLAYYWNGETWTLPGLDSYIFQFQKKKNLKSRALLTVPTPEYLQNQYHQFFISFQTDTIYQICNFYRIKTHKIAKVSQQFKRFLGLIQNQFNPIYFVAYARNVNRNIAQEVCLNIYYTQEKNKQILIPLSFNMKTGQVGLKKSDSLVYNVSQKKYVDWFKIRTHASEVHNVEECLQK